jgi:L-fuculose-phosphate aldolase
MNMLEARRAVIEGMARLDALGMNRNATGNLSLRVPDGFLVTPTGMTTREMRPGDIVFVEMDGAAHGPRKPSSEWRFHRDILASRPDVNAVLHSHANACITLACLGMEIPAFHYMVAVAGGKTVRCAKYATFGTQELSDNAVAALKDRKACLLANHGMIALGVSVPEALSIAIEVEALAEQYWRALQIGKPTILSDAEMDRVLEKFQNYGQAR